MTTEAKVCLVTGASRGIGAAISDQLGNQGYTVIGTATSQYCAQRVAGYLCDQARGAECARCGGCRRRGQVQLAGALGQCAGARLVSNVAVKIMKKDHTCSIYRHICATLCVVFKKLV